MFPPFTSIFKNKKLFFKAVDADQRFFLWLKSMYYYDTTMQILAQCVNTRSLLNQLTNRIIKPADLAIHKSPIFLLPEMKPFERPARFLYPPSLYPNSRFLTCLRQLPRRYICYQVILKSQKNWFASHQS